MLDVLHCPLSTSCRSLHISLLQKNKNGQYPLHCVIESQCLENLLQIVHLLSDSNRCSSYVNVKQKNGENSLHILARVMTNENVHEIFEMIKILISYGCNANCPNSDDKTPFLTVLENLQIQKVVNRKEVFNYLLENANIDFYSYRSADIIEMATKENLNFILPERENFSFSFESMKKLLDKFNINKFETLFKSFKATCTDSEFYQESCAVFMEIAVKNSLINIVDLLIGCDADINRIAKNSELNVPPSFLVCIDPNPALLNLFLSDAKIKLSFKNNSGNRQTLLHQFFKINQKQGFSKEQKKCFDFVMDNNKCDRNLINENDENDLPVIYYAVRYKNDYATMRLLLKGSYIGPVINSIRKNLLEEFLDSTFTANNKSYDVDNNELKIDYTFLWPPGAQKMNTSGKKDNGNIHHSEAAINDSSDHYSEEVQPLAEIANKLELQHLLAHPTIASFILLKWNKISFLVYINMIIILSFIFSFMPFVYLCQNLEMQDKNTNFFYSFFRVTSLLSILCFIVRELTQAMLSIKNYVLNLSNWIDICLMSLATVVLLFETLLTNNWSRMLRTIVILLATAEYFSILGMVPIMSISIHTKMFRKVCTTFLKWLSFYSMLIVAFGFCFYNMQGDKFLKDNIARKTAAAAMNVNSTTNVESMNDAPAFKPPTDETRSDRFNNFYTIGEVNSSYLKLNFCFFFNFERRRMLYIMQ